MISLILKSKKGNFFYKVKKGNFSVVYFAWTLVRMSCACVAFRLIFENVPTQSHSFPCSSMILNNAVSPVVLEDDFFMKSICPHQI